MTQLELPWILRPPAWKDIHGDKRVSVYTYEMAQRIGRERSRSKGDRSTTCLGREDTHEFGLIGEALFGALVYQPVNLEQYEFGDGKTDFIVNDLRVDVKLVSRFKWPWLTVVAASVYATPAYALVAYDETRRVARYCGWATPAMLIKVPPRILNANCKPSHVLTEAELYGGLPRSSPPEPERRTIPAWNSKRRSSPS